MTQETLREAGSKALCRRLTSCSGFCHSLRCRDAIENFGDAMDAALSLMQPEIDRRVAEERAKLLQRLREPSEGMIEAGKAIGRYEGHHVYCRHIEDDTVPCVCGYLAAHNSLRDAIDKFQQENSDER